MSPTSPQRPSSVRSAAVVNEEIRALWKRGRGLLAPSDRDRYRELLAEWAAADRASVTEAA